MRQMPDDPTAEQVDVWTNSPVVADEDFQRRVREMAVAGAAAPR
ncbi:hypothetical protein AB0B54_23140 [Microbispora bryophytorum]